MNRKLLAKLPAYAHPSAPILSQVFSTFARLILQQYRRFENGVFELNYEQLLALCRLLDTTPNELYGVDD